MRNPLRERLDAGKTSAGVLASMPSVTMAQTLANSGFDWLFIDMEHGPIDIATAHSMITATAGTECAPVVRVMEPRISYTKPVLDAGAMGVVFPMITSKALAEQAVKAVRYPPEGERGWGPFYAPMRWGNGDALEYFKASGEVVIIALIEHIEAVENIHEILMVAGIDVFLIAPMDLAASLGHVGNRDHPDVQSAIARAEQAILGAGRPMGGLCLSVEEGNEKIAKGYQVILMGFDLLLLNIGAASMLDGLKR
ncbi:MAG: 2,4-dihydroxyhept-2-ene-1,7-dioic acid aldolase [Rhodospirillaceae bacterium]|mgnify:CR=1 FL=1|nr:2,4-dihydroxyhept-2-ene-1,7-dioic acid aldolase [Rhodospirillaceae bacterium]